MEHQTPYQIGDIFFYPYSYYILVYINGQYGAISLNDGHLYGGGLQNNINDALIDFNNQGAKLRFVGRNGEIVIKFSKIN